MRYRCAEISNQAKEGATPLAHMCLSEGVPHFKSPKKKNSWNCAKAAMLKALAEVSSGGKRKKGPGGSVKGDENLKGGESNFFRGVREAKGKGKWTEGGRRGGVFSQK